MRQPTSQELYAYWNRVRNGRIAPRRFEIEPAKISALLPETFIAECNGQSSIRFRLAGTKICEQFGRELRGIDLLSLWAPKDRDALASAFGRVTSEAAVAELTFEATTDADRRATFELTLMPLIHSGAAINRVLGSISAVEPPFWLGAAPLTHFAVTELQILWPDGAPAKPQSRKEASSMPSRVIRIAQNGFRVYEGGRAESRD